MDFILPSNVAAETYPENTTSRYTTPLINPLSCDGEWEVGVKSIFYSAQVGDEKEKGRVTLKTTCQKEVRTNDLYPVRYRLTSDHKWNYEPHTFAECKPCDYDKVRDSLNSVNEKVVEKGSPRLFSFNGKLTQYMRYKTEVEGLTLRFTGRMAAFLGYGYEIFLNKYGRKYVQTSIFTPEKLQPSDYQIQIFDRNVVKEHATVIIKPKGEGLLTTKELVQRWNERVGKYIRTRAEYKSHKFIISLYETKNAIVLNQHFNYSIYHGFVLFGRGEFWPMHPYTPKKSSPKTEEDEWRVTIYKDECRTTHVTKDYTLDYELYPRRYKISELLTHLSNDLTNLLQSKTPCTDKIDFSLVNNLTTVTLPSNTTLELSSNLKNMLGLDQTLLKAGRQQGTILPVTLDRREQEIFIHVDISDVVQYGNEARRMLQHFIHNAAQNEGIVEKWFEPIVYQPVLSPFIESITIQLLNQDNEPHYFKDKKTIVTLHFRRRR